MQAIDNNYEASAFAPEQTFTVNVAGMESPEAGNLKVYPNPLTASSVIEMNLSAPAVVSLNIYDLSGRLMVQVDGGVAMEGALRIPLGDLGLQAGIYFVSLLLDGEPTGQTLRLVSMN